MSGRIVIAAVTAVVLLGACHPAPKPLPVCAGKGSTDEALLELAKRTRNVVPLRATGTCKLRYYVEGKRKAENEGFPARLYVNPPAQICLHGDVAFDARAVVLGSNSEEFWLAIRPKISTYWRGSWSQSSASQKLILNPRIVLDALGVAASETGDRSSEWSLSNKGPFDILTRRDDAGLILKRLYVCSCDYLVRKIEYFDEFGRVSVVAELDKYKQVADGFSVPSSIKVIRRGTAGRDDSAAITLKSIKAYEFSKKQVEFLFTPQPGRYKNLYELIDGQWIERLQ